MMATITVTLEDQHVARRGLLHKPCSKTMKGRTKKINGILRSSWLKPCPNPATIIYRDRAYCDHHLPPSAKKDHD